MLQTFLCDCGGTLNQSIDFQSLKKELEKEGDAATFLHSLLCQKDGLNFIKEQVEKGKPRAIVIGACSKRILTPLLEDLLKGQGSQVFEIVNLREQCAWVHADKTAATTKAKLMLRAAIEKARGSKPVEAKELKAKERVLVIGGGVAGIQASLDLANQGLKVYLIERAPTIGGKMALLVKTYPTDDCAICILGPKMADAASHPNITVLTYHEVVGVEKLQNGFRVKIKKKPRYVDVEKCTGCGICAEKCPVKVPNEWDGGLGYRKAIYIPYPQALPRKYLIDSEHCLYFQKGVCRVCEKMCPRGAPNFEEKPEEMELDVGSIIVATGFEEYDPSHLPKYGFGKLKDVITQFQLARLLDPSGPTGGKLERPSDSKRPKRIVMVQCVGSRDPETNPYCSRYCCMAAMKNAMLIKVEQDPEADITILYKDVRAAGKGFEEYYLRAKERFGVKFVKGDLIQISQDPTTKELNVEFEAPNHEKSVVKSDLVVLSCAMVPPSGMEQLASLLGIKVAPDGFVKALDEKVCSIETNVPGIYVCGTVEGPKDIPESVAQASAAASCAARAVMKVAQKPAPALLINEEACGKCGLCVLSCPFEALRIDEKENKVVVDEAACRGCGLCATVCGSGAIELPNNARAQISQQIQSILKDGSNALHPLVLAFCCDECGYSVLDTVGFQRKRYPPGIIPIFVPCLSSLSIHHVIEALSLGADGVLILGCLEDRCHFEEGAAKARLRVEFIKLLLRELGLLENKANILMLSGNMTQDFVSKVNEVIDQLR